MIQMFDKKVDSAAEKATALSVSRMQMSEEAEETYAEMKIGKVAQLVMRPILESGRIPDSEVLQLQNKTYCNEILNLNFPLLVKTDCEDAFRGRTENNDGIGRSLIVSDLLTHLNKE